MYDNCAMDECEELFKHLQYKDFSELRYNVPKLALQANIKRAKAVDYAKEIIKIAEKSLRRNQTGDTLFLDEIREYTEKDYLRQTLSKRIGTVLGTKIYENSSSI